MTYLDHSQHIITFSFGSVSWSPSFNIYSPFLVLIIVFLNLILFYYTYKRNLNMNLIKIILILIFSEILIGLFMFYGGFPFSSQPLHLFIATILFGIQFYSLLFFQNYNSYEKRNLSNT